MGFSFEHLFTVKAPADKVFAYLTDPYRVAPALPGAALGERSEDGSYSGTITVKVGPVSARYKGKARFDNLDASGRTVSIVATGQDTSGRGGADMRMQGNLVESAPGETQVSLRSDVNVTGILAQFGRGMIQDVSNQIFKKFSDAVRAELEGDAAAAAAAAPPTAAAAAAEAVPAAEAAPPPAAAAAAEAATASAAATPAAAEVRSVGPPVAVSALRMPPPASEPLDLGSLGTKAMGRAAIRSFAKPGLWVVILLVILALYWMMYR
jgi:carbon monoxide dehydrogenase subunit G